MKISVSLFVVGLAFALNPLKADDNTINGPKVAHIPYYGTGSAERAPDYGEVRFTFRIDCQSSPDAVYRKIQAESGKIWNTIVSQVSPDQYSETERTYWGKISDVTTSDPVSVQEKLGQRQYVRMNRCTNQEVSLKQRVPLVYGGSQTFGVRTSKMDWLEGLASAVKKIPPAQKPGDLMIAVSSINYDGTRATYEAMKAEVLAKATNEAVGPGSEFQADLASLKFQEVYPGDRRVVPSAPYIGTPTGDPVKAGQAPRVNLKVKVRYGFYVETGNVLNQNAAAANQKVGQNNNQYDEVGEAQTSADYAETTIHVSSGCHKTSDEATEAIKAKFGKVMDLVKGLQGNKAFTETDRYSIQPVASATSESALQPVEYDEDANKLRKTTKYLDTCSMLTVSAHDGEGNPLAYQYYRADQSVTIKSSDFASLDPLVDQLLALNDANPGSQAVIVDAPVPTGKLTDQTLKALAVKARVNASSCLLNPDSALNREGKTKEFGYKCANLVSVDVRPFSEPRMDSYENAAPMALSKARAPMAPGGAPQQQDTIPVKIEVKDNQTRPTLSLSQTIEFDYKVITRDFLHDQKQSSAAKNLSN